MSVKELKRQDQRTRRRAPSKAGDESIVSSTDTDVVRMAAASAAARAAERKARVATAAYFRAQKRGCEPGHELDDWLAAEADTAADVQDSFATPVELIGSGSAS
jgi:hypothetical protein